VEIRRAQLEELPACSCRADDELPCGPQSNCINRSMMYECHPLICRAGDRCLNQVFQQRRIPQMEPFNTGSHGWGLRTLVNIEGVCRTFSKCLLPCVLDANSWNMPPAVPPSRTVQFHLLIYCQAQQSAMYLIVLANFNHRMVCR